MTKDSNGSAERLFRARRSREAPLGPELMVLRQLPRGKQE